MGGKHAGTLHSDLAASLNVARMRSWEIQRVISPAERSVTEVFDESDSQVHQCLPILTLVTSYSRRATAEKALMCNPITT
jgi:hypothetical protein